MKNAIRVQNGELQKQTLDVRLYVNAYQIFTPFVFRNLFSSFGD